MHLDVCVYVFTVTVFKYHEFFRGRVYMLASTSLGIWTCLHVVSCLHFAAVVEDVKEERISHLSGGLDRTRRLCRETRLSLEKLEIDLCFIKSH